MGHRISRPNTFATRTIMIDGVGHVELRIQNLIIGPNINLTTLDLVKKLYIQGDIPRITTEVVRCQLRSTRTSALHVEHASISALRVQSPVRTSPSWTRRSAST